MKAYNMSVAGRYELAEQLDRLDKYETGDLLYVLRAIESGQYKYDKNVVKKVVARPAKKNIICM